MALVGDDKKEEFESKNRNNAIRKIKADVNLNPLIALFKDRSYEVIFEQMNAYLLQPESKMDLSDFKTFIIHNNQEDFIKTLALRLMSVPEYQLC